MQDFLQAYSWLAAVAITLVASFMQSLTGFGFAIIAAPLLIVVYDPKEVVLILQLMSLVINTVFCFVLRKSADWKFVLVLSLGSLIGQPIGLLIYRVADSGILKIFISLLILAFLLIKQLSCKAIQETRNRNLAVGVLSGLLNAATAMPGPPLILYMTACNREKASMRASSIAYFTFISWTATLGYFVSGQDLSAAAGHTVILLPAAAAGLIVGHLLFPYLSQNMFQKIIFVMMAFSSLYTLYSIL